MARFLKAAVIVGVTAALMSGCLLKETSETWYVDASGAVNWVVTERDVRSDANAIADRQQEESVYWLAVQQQRHPIALGLQELGGSKLRTAVLRNEVPYTVQTDARFSGLDEIGRRLLAAVGALGESAVKHEAQTWEWTFVARDPQSLGAASEPSEGVSALVNEFGSLRVVLMAGRFESAQGFSLSNDNRIATFDEKFAEGQQEQTTITIKLRWKN